MSNEGRARENGYRAFISYSHRDDAAAKSLHKRLETYRLPKKLIGQAGERGPIPERLTPIFRDLDELSAADDLTVEIKAALTRSATLIVLCSPGAKASKWVNLEIETFRALHGNTRPVLAALIEGEPADAFPPALIADGQEPVAADFRKNRDGKRLALLKLVAGMAGAPLDALVQRDAQRQYRRVMAITGTALTAALAMALLLVVALRAQSEAERQRQEAEGLVEYMLTDLRDRLKGVGRLDVMTAVNERAMKYYGGDSVKGQLLKARTLHALGEDDERRGNLAKSGSKFATAYRLSNDIATKFPQNIDAIYTKSESIYWLGYINQKRKNYEYAKKHYLYQILNLQKINPADRDYRYNRLLYQAYNAIGVLYFEDLKNSERSLIYFKKNQKFLEKISNINYKDKDLKYKLADNYAWIADVYFSIGHNNQAKNMRRTQAKIIDKLLSVDPLNKRYIWSRIGIDRAIFRICYKINNDICASRSISTAASRLSRTSYDLSDSSWIWMSFYVALDQGFMNAYNKDCSQLILNLSKSHYYLIKYTNQSPNSLFDIKSMQYAYSSLKQKKCNGEAI